MARFFDIQIISGTAPGPYTIYYDTINVSNIVTLTNSGNLASNISFSTLSLGVNVTIPDGATSIILFNEQCSNDETFIIPTQTPTPTPTSTPTPTPTPTSTPTPTPTATNTPTPTPTPNCAFGVDLDINYPPTDISLTNNYITENSAINTTIGTFSTTTLDVSDTHTYSIVGGSTIFNISGNTLRSSVVFDYESGTSHNITIRTTDSVGQYYDKLFTIIIINVTIVVTASVDTAITCYGNSDGIIVVTNVSGGSGPYTYSKDGTNYQSSTTFNGLGAGSYTIYAKDSNGEIGATIVTLSRTEITATVSQTNLSCFNGGNGSILISNVSGGQGGPYSTKLNVGGTYQVLSTSRNYTSLSAGSYTVYVKDTVGCEVTYPITLTQPTQVTVTLNSSTPPTCYNGGDGSISFSAGGGNGSYQYRLNSGTWQPSGIFTGLSVGTYTIQTRDTNGCESSTTNVTLSKSAPTATVTQSNISCNGGSNGSISITSPSGGSGSEYTFSIDGVNYQSSGTFSSLPTGSYDIYVKDGAGCVSYLTTISITQPSEQTSTITVDTYATCNGGADGTITLSSTGGTFPKTYRLYADTSAPYTTCGGDLIGTYTGVTSGSPSVSVSGIDEFGYCLEVTDANGCLSNSGVVETTSCNGTCYEVTIQSLALTNYDPNTNQTEDLWIIYTTPDNVQINAPIYQFFQTGDNQTSVTINVCSIYNLAYKYGENGNVNIMSTDGNISIVVMGNCGNSEWCGGNDPYTPPAPTPTPTPEVGGYFCKEDEFSPCIEQINPCSGFQISCDEFLNPV